MLYLTGEKTISYNILWNMPGKSAGSGKLNEASRTCFFGWWGLNGYNGEEMKMKKIVNFGEECYHTNSNSSACAIGKAAPAVLSRCVAANFAHKPALSTCIEKQKNVQAHFVLFVNAWLNCYYK